MPRVKGGTVARRRRKKILKLAKGYFGSKHTLYKTAHEQVMKSFMYSYRDRRQKKRDFRKLWITRINAAARLNGMTYSTLINGLNLANIDVNRKMLAELAVNDAASFTAIADQAKAALEKKNTNLTQTDDLSKLTVAQLKELAAERDVKIPSTAKKADIVELLQA